MTRSLATVVGAQWTSVKQISDRICGKAGFQSPKVSRFLPSDSVLLGRVWASVCILPMEKERRKLPSRDFQGSYRSHGGRASLERGHSLDRMPSVYPLTYSWELQQGLAVFLLCTATGQALSH